MSVTSRVRGAAIRAVAALVALTVLSGCREDQFDRADVSGAVTFDGEPVASGSIKFLPMGDTRAPLSGTNIVDGRYALGGERGPIVGRYRVEIEGVRPTGRKIPGHPPSSSPDDLIDEIEQYIPEKYNRSSTLTVELKSGENPLDFHLESGG